MKHLGQELLVIRERKLVYDHKCGHCGYANDGLDTIEQHFYQQCMLEAAEEMKEILDIRDYHDDYSVSIKIIGEVLAKEKGKQLIENLRKSAGLSKGQPERLTSKEKGVGEK